MYLHLRLKFKADFVGEYWRENTKCVVCNEIKVAH